MGWAVSHGFGSKRNTQSFITGLEASDDLSVKDHKQNNL